MNYTFVLDELRRGIRDENRMAQAFVEAEGDEKKTQALYMKYRLQDLLVQQTAARETAGAESAANALIPQKKFSFPLMIWSGLGLEFVIIAIAYLSGSMTEPMKDAGKGFSPFFFVGAALYIAWFYAFREEVPATD